MKSVLGRLLVGAGFLANVLGLFGLTGGVIAFIAGNRARGRELVVGGVIWFVLGFILFRLGSIVNHKETGK